MHIFITHVYELTFFFYFAGNNQERDYDSYMFGLAINQIEV